MGRVISWLTDQRGSGAAEFALVVPLFVLAVLGVIHLAALVNATSALHWTVEQSARCAVVSRAYSTAPVADPTAACQTRAATATYATSIYKGPSISATFVATENTTCGGRRVVGTATYPIRTGIINVNVPISAAACFPTVIDAAAPWT